LLGFAALFGGIFFARQGYIEQFSDELGIIVEGFVKVAQAIEQDGFGLLGFEFLKLAVPFV
jgi:hypothetical protein